MSPAASRALVHAQASACGKAILFGEHAVVHGAPALAVPLTARRLTVDVTFDEVDDPERTDATRAVRVTSALALDPALAEAMAERALELESESGREHEHDHDHEHERERENADHDHDTDAAARRERPAGAKRRGLFVKIHSDLPPGAGLGSSAALAVALVRALDPALAPDVVARRAHELERLAHGTPSGLDTLVVTTEQAVRFCHGAPPRTLRPIAQLKLAVALLPRAGTTRSLVAGVRALAEAGDPRFAAMIATATRTTDEAIALLEAPGERSAAEVAAALGALAREAHAALRAVGVSTDAQDALCRALEQAGALGAKLSGAGGGGATIAVLSPDASPAEERALLAAARAAGATEAFIACIEPDCVATPGRPDDQRVRGAPPC